MDRHHDAAELLLSVRRDPSQRLRSLPDAMRPQNAEQAYLIQREVMGRLGAVGGWKVGSPNPTSTSFTCAPLPQTGIHDGPADIMGSDRGVEAEIAVRLGADLPVREAAYSLDEVKAAIASAHPAIEVLASRFVDSDALDPATGLADSLSHHSLILGPAIVRWQQIDLTHEEVGLIVNGAEIKRKTGNPGGDMLRLVAWLANTGARWAGGLKAGQVVTTGSWTGKDYVPEGAAVTVRFEHCGEIDVRFAA